MNKFFKSELSNPSDPLYFYNQQIKQMDDTKLDEMSNLSFVWNDEFPFIWKIEKYLEQLDTEPSPKRQETMRNIFFALQMDWKNCYFENSGLLTDIKYGFPDVDNTKVTKFGKLIPLHPSRAMSVDRPPAKKKYQTADSWSFY